MHGLGKEVRKMADTYRSKVYTERPAYKAVEDLEKIKPYEPNVVKAAWNIFGKSYLYRQAYNEYKAERDRKSKE